MSTTITVNVVETNGLIDEARMKTAFFNQLAQLVAERTDSTDKIAHAADEVFDSCAPDARINLPHLVSMTISAMKVSPNDYGKWEERVREYFRSASKCEAPLFNIGKGSKCGGVKRLKRATTETLSADVLIEDVAAE